MTNNHRTRFFECVKNEKIRDSLLNYLGLADLMNFSQLSSQIKSDITTQKAIKRAAVPQIIRV